MRRVFRTILLAFTVGFALTDWVLGADMPPRPMPVKAIPAPIWTWDGFWFGLTAGAALTKTNVAAADLTPEIGFASIGSFHNNGLLLGGEVDARYTIASGIVVGLDAIIDWANTKGGDGGCVMIVVTCQTKNGFFGFVGGEVGITSLGGQTNLPYNPANLTPVALPIGNAKISALAGVAFRQFEMVTNIPFLPPTIPSLGKESHTVAGFAPGVAIDVAAMSNLSFGIRWLHPLWNQNSCAGALEATLGVHTVACTFKDKEDVFLANASIKF